MVNQYALPRDDRKARVDQALAKAKARSKEIAARPDLDRPRRDIDWTDVGKSAATGLRSGLESTLGGIGDIGDLQSKVTAYGAEKLGMSPTTAATVGKYTNPMSLFPNTEDIGKVTDAVAGRDDDITRHTSTTPQGQNIASASNFLSGLVGGPENLGKDVALKLGMSMIPAAKLAERGVSKVGRSLMEKTGREALTEAKAAPLLKSAPGTEGVSSALPLANSRIAQRVPTSPTAPENASQNLLINMNVMRSDPAKMKQAADIISTYPGFGSNAMKEMHPEERLDAARKQMTDNLLYMHDMMPPEARQRASQWYLGANKIANERAAEVGIHPAAAAGTYASLSPQKDWFQNVDMGDWVLRTLAEDPKVTADHLAVARSIYKPEEAGLLRGMEGRRLSEMAPEEQSLAIRLFEEIRGKGNRPYRQISPEGNYGDFVLASGKPRQLAWQNTTNIEKAIGAAGSGGDPMLLSGLMGDRHKVRNFYNNIVAPREGEQFGDITADTHQIAASLFRPLGGSHPDVATGLGGSPSSNMTGMRGLYPLYADATRQASILRDQPVRAMQSIPWEGIRSLFPDTFKTAKNQQIVDDIWRSFDRGEISADQARKSVVEAAGGFRPPSW